MTNNILNNILLGIPQAAILTDNKLTKTNEENSIFEQTPKNNELNSKEEFLTQENANKYFETEAKIKIKVAEKIASEPKKIFNTAKYKEEIRNEYIKENPEYEIIYKIYSNIENTANDFINNEMSIWKEENKYDKKQETKESYEKRKEEYKREIIESYRQLNPEYDTFLNQENKFNTISAEEYVSLFKSIINLFG